MILRVFFVELREIAKYHKATRRSHEETRSLIEDLTGFNDFPPSGFIVESIFLDKIYKNLFLSRLVRGGKQS